MSQAKQIAEDFLAMKKATKADLDKLTEKPTESMADVVEEFEEEQKDWQAAYNAGGSFSQKLEEISHHGKRVEEEPAYAEASMSKGTEEVMEVPGSPEMEKKPDLAGYIERVEKAAESQQVVIDDYTQQVLLKPVGGQKTKITLPLTSDQVQAGLHMQIWEGIRWLAEWCVRQVKILKDRVSYKENTDSHKSA